MGNKKKYLDSQLQEVIDIYEPKIKILKHLQSLRSQKYIVIVTDDREHLDFSLGEHGDHVVDVISIPNMKITNVHSTVVKHPKYGKGTVFVFSGGTHDLLESVNLSDCLKAGCESPVSLFSLPIGFSIECYNVHYLIRKSLNLHFDILHATDNDIVLFCGLLPVNIKHHNDYNIRWRACGTIHSVSQESIVEDRKYRKALRLFNDFTKYHAQALGYEPWDLEMKYYTDRSEAIFLPDGYHINFREDNRRANRVKLLCEGILPDAFSPKVPMEKSYQAKLFVRLCSVTPERGKRYFEQFGRIVESHFEKSVKHEDMTLGTVTFSEASMADHVIGQKPHTIDGKRITVNRYRPSSRRAPNLFLNEPKNKLEKISLLETGCSKKDLRNEDKREPVECSRSGGSGSPNESVSYSDVKLQRIGAKFQAQFDELVKLQEKRLQNNIVIITDERDEFDVNLVGVDVMKVPFLKFGKMALSEVKRHPKFGTGTLFVFSSGVHDLLHSNHLVECLNNKCVLPQNILALPSYNGDSEYLVKKALHLHLQILNSTQHDSVLFCGMIPVSVDIYNEYVVGSRPCLSNHAARYMQNGNFHKYKNYVATVHIFNDFAKYHARTLGYQPWDIEQPYFKSSREFNYLKIDGYNISREGNLERSKRIKELCLKILTTKSTRSTMLDTSTILKGAAPPSSQNFGMGCHSEDLYDEPIIYLNYEQVVIISDSRYLPFLRGLKNKGVHLMVEDNIEIDNLRDFFWRKRNSLTARTLYLFVVGVHSVAKTGPFRVCKSLNCVDPLESLESWADSDLNNFTPEFAKKLIHRFKRLNSIIPRQSSIAVLPPLPVSLICESLPHDDLHVKKSHFPNYMILQRMSMINRLYPEWVHKFTLTAVSSIIACTCVERSSFNKLNADNWKLEVMECSANDSPSYSVWNEVVNNVVEVALKNSGTCDNKAPVHRKQRRCRDFKDPDILNCSLKIDPQAPIYEVENVVGTQGDEVSDPLLNFEKNLKNLNFNYFSGSMTRIFEVFASFLNKSKEGNDLAFPKSPLELEGQNDKINEDYSENNINKASHHIATKVNCEAKRVSEKRRNSQRKVVFVGSAASLELLPGIDFCSVSKWYDGDIARMEKLSMKVDKLNQNGWKEITFIFISDLRMLKCHEKTPTCLLRKCKRPFTQIKATEFCSSGKYDQINVIKFIIENAIKEIRKLCRFVPKFIIAPFTPFINVKISNEFLNSSIHSEMHDYGTCLNNVCLVPRSNWPRWKELLLSFAKEWNEFSIEETNKDPVVRKRIKLFLYKSGDPVAWKEFSSKENNFSESGLLIRWKSCIRWVVKDACNCPPQLIHDKLPSNEKDGKGNKIEVAEVELGLTNSSRTLPNKANPKPPIVNKAISTTTPLAKELRENEAVNYVPNKLLKKELFHDSLVPLSESENFNQTALASNHSKDNDIRILNPVVVKQETLNEVLTKPVVSESHQHRNVIVKDFDYSLRVTNTERIKREDVSNFDIKISQNAITTTSNFEHNENNLAKSEGVTENAFIEIKEEKFDLEPKTSDSCFQFLNCSTIKDEEFLNLESPLPLLRADNSNEISQISGDIKTEPSDVSLSRPEGGIGAIISPNLSNYFQTNFDFDHLVVIGNSAAKEFLDCINFFSTSHWKFDNPHKLFRKISDLSNNFKSVLFVVFCDISMIFPSTKINTTITDVQNIISNIYQYCYTKKKVIVSPFNTDVALTGITDSKLDKIWELSLLSFSKEWKKLTSQAQILENLFLKNFLTSEFFPINWNYLSILDCSNDGIETLEAPLKTGSLVSKGPHSCSLAQIKNENTQRCGIESKYVGDMSEGNVVTAHNTLRTAPPGQGVYRVNRKRSKSPESFPSKKLKTAGPISSSSFAGSSDKELTLPFSDFTPAFKDEIGSALFEKFTMKVKVLKQTFEEKFQIYKAMPELYPNYRKYYEVFDNKFNENGNVQRKDILWKTFWDKNFEAIKEDDWQIEFLKLKSQFEEFLGNYSSPPPTDSNCQVVNYPPQSVLHSPTSPQPPISLLPHIVSCHSYIPYLPPSLLLSPPPPLPQPSLPPPLPPPPSLLPPSLNLFVSEF